MTKAKKLSDYKNLGKKSETLLNQVGIFTIEDIEAIGVVEVWKRVKAIQPKASLMGALQGALMNIHWNLLPDEIKADIRRQWKSEA